MVILVVFLAAVSAAAFAGRHIIKAIYIYTVVEAMGGNDVNIKEDAVLESLYWGQTGMSYYECFSFGIWQDDGEYFINVESFLPGIEERVCFENVPISEEQWQKAEKYIQGRDFRVYRPTAPGVLDATESSMAINYYENGEKKSANVSGINNYELREIIESIALEVMPETDDGGNETAEDISASEAVD